MLKFFTRTFLVGFALFTFYACQEKEVVTPVSGTFELAFTLPESSNEGGRIKSNVSYAVVTIKQGNVILHDKQQLTLYKFGDQYITEGLSLKPGTFNLTEFLLTDENNEVMYVTPLEGSALAHLVNDPLPISFTIQKDSVTKISPEVLAVDSQSAEDFGYTTFDFNVVDYFKFYLGVFIYNASTANLELTSSILSVSNGDSILVSDSLSNITNTIYLNSGSDNFTLTVSKSGYISYSKTFTQAELEAFSAEPLMVTLLPQTLNENLVAYYPFNNSANDSSGNGLHGTVYGASLTTDRKSNSNSAYYFDGSSYISVADNDLLDFTSSHNFSISLWVSVNSNQILTGGINDILRKWNGDAQGYPFGISYNNEGSATAEYRKTFLASRYDGSSCYNIPAVFSPVVDYETFHHLVLVKEGTTIKFYLNNELVATTTDSTNCTTGNDSHMTIGCRGQLVRFFTGKIDDIRIYSKAINESQIGALYNE